MNKSKAFTLVELLVVIAIIGILATVVVMSVSGAQTRAKVSKAKADLNQIAQAMNVFAQETGEYPFHYTSDCNALYIGTDKTHTSNGNDEFPVASKHSGLFGQDESDRPGDTFVPIPYSDWNGPYLTMSANDPWGNPYYFDPDYVCVPGYPPGVPTRPLGANVGQNEIACLATPAPNTVRAVMSNGPDRKNGYGDDNIVYRMCQK